MRSFDSFNTYSVNAVISWIAAIRRSDYGISPPFRRRDLRLLLQPRFLYFALYPGVIYRNDDFLFFTGT